jgi:hypothetical protein
MSALHVRLAKGELLSMDEVKREVPLAGEDLRKLLTPHIRDRVAIDELFKCDDDSRIQRALSNYVLEREREQHALRGGRQSAEVYVPQRVVALFESLHPDRSLDDMLRRSPLVAALSSIFFAALSVFNEDDCDAIVGVARALLAARGIDCLPLDRHLADSKAELETGSRDRGFTLYGDKL